MAQAQEEPSKAPAIDQQSQLVKMINAQRREEAKMEVATAIYACGIHFDVVRSPYW